MTDFRLVVVVPSRGRPDAVAALWEAWRATVGEVASLVVYVDDDDPLRVDYLAGPARHVVRCGPRRRLGPTLNQLAPELAHRYDAVGFMGDDHRPRTVGWDVRIAAELGRLGAGVVYGDDGFQHDRIPTAVAISSAIIRTLGYMVPPGMMHMYLDDFWRLLGESIGRLSYLPDMFIEHMHPQAGKGVWDDGYREVNASEVFQADRAAFDMFLHGRWPADLNRLRMMLAADAKPAETV